MIDNAKDYEKMTSNLVEETSENNNNNINNKIAMPTAREKLEEDFFDDDLEDKEQDVGWYQRYFSSLKEGSLRGSILSIASICFGPASLSFPLAIATMGLIPGTLLLVLLTIISFWSLHILLYAGRRKKMMNYSLLIKECLGDIMLLVSDVNNMIFCYGVLMVYIFTATQFFMEVINSLFNVDLKNNTVKLIQMLSCMVIIQIPLGLLKDMSKLRYASLIGSLTLLYTLLVMLIESFFYFSEARDEGRNIQLFTEFNWSYLDSFSIFLYAYASHNGIFSIYSEMKRPTLRRSKKVLNRALILLVVLFSIIGYSGFFSLIKNTPSIFISRPPLKLFANGIDYFIIISKILFFCSLQCMCAINYNILKGSIKSFFFKAEEPSFFMTLVVTIFVFLTGNLITFFVDNVVKIVGILGGICAVIVCYVSPVLCYIQSNGLPKTHWKNIMSMIILSVICIIGIMSTTNSIINNFKKSN